jgi:hypothetical protein
MTMKRSLQTILTIALFSPPLTGYLMIHDFLMTSIGGQLPPIERFVSALREPAFVFGIGAYLVIVAIAVLGLRGQTDLASGPAKFRRST